MWQDFLNWWSPLWSDATVLGGAIAGFVSALIMFIFGDVIWKSRMERIKLRVEYQQKQLNFFYAPLYQFYRGAYKAFDSWQKENSDTKLVRQPFFDKPTDEIFAENIFFEHPGLASQKILRQWVDYKAIDKKTQCIPSRNKMINTLIKEYHSLRKKLDLDYDKKELRAGEFEK